MYELRNYLIMSNNCKGKFDSCTSITTKDEADLLQKKIVTPEDVLRLKHFTTNFLCTASDVVKSLLFIRFTVRDLTTGSILFEVKKPPDCPIKSDNIVRKNIKSNTRIGRYVRYQFSPTLLEMKTIGATIEFTMGDNEINNFRMIERHFYKDKLLKTFDFEFGLCLPNSSNTCEHIYQIPKLSPKLIQEIINNPFETRSDSFYFADGHLIMHNKADYSYKA